MIDLVGQVDPPYVLIREFQPIEFVQVHTERKLRLTLVMSLYKTLLSGGVPPSSSLRVLRLLLRVRVSKFQED